MDIQRLRAIARDLMEIPDMADDFRYFVGSFAVMLSDQPLTLDAAEKVMGREPDWKRDSNTRSIIQWDSPDITVSNWNVGEVAVQWGRESFVMGTIGQFACLVAAARQGETA